MILPARLAFDEFELRLDSGELFREGSLVAQLQPQPARLLELLASRSGEVVGREEIRQFVWGDSFVDFDASLNFCVKQLRRALGDSATSPRYIETLPRRGYRFLQPVRNGAEAKGASAPVAVAEIVPSVVPDIALETRPIPARASPLQRLGMRWRLLTGATATLAALILLIVLIASRADFPPRNARLSVFPLACQGKSPADPQVCGGITEVLTEEITRRLPAQALEVVGPTSSQVYQKSGMNARDTGRKLGATHLLTGAVEISGGRLRIDARMAKTAGEILWQETFEGDLMDAPNVYEKIARRVAKALRVSLPPTPTTKDRPSEEAIEACLQASYLRHQWQFAEAAEKAGKAVALAPRYARAYAELALARPDREIPPQEDAPASRAAAQRAIELDPNLPEAHLAMADVQFKDLLDWKTAEKEFQQALLRSPGSAEILHDYATYLIALGKNDEGLAMVSRARELDPASTFITSDYAWFLFLARHYDEAIRQARNTLSLIGRTRSLIPANMASFGSSWSLHVLTYASLRQGDDRTALESAKERSKDFGQEAATARLRSMHDFLEWRYQFVAHYVRDHPGNSFTIAQAAAVSGRIDEALDALEKECRNGGEQILFHYVAVNPLFDNLHGDPRFARIVDCTHLPQDAPARLALQVKTASR
jgi:DNA-binding winged helix-turn-helix (wHTH) protein/TolB-like protein